MLCCVSDYGCFVFVKDGTLKLHGMMSQDWLFWYLDKSTTTCDSVGMVVCSDKVLYHGLGDKFNGAVDKLRLSGWVDWGCCMEACDIGV